MSSGAVDELLPLSWDKDQHLPIAESLAAIYQPTQWMLLILACALFCVIVGARDSARRAALIPLGIVTALALCTLLILGAQPRYRYPLDPPMQVIAAAGLVWFAAEVRCPTMAPWDRGRSERPLGRRGRLVDRRGVGEGRVDGAGHTLARNADNVPDRKMTANVSGRR